ncbi:hypothetical protein DK842_10105 [Chromobacterium phragmitis]|uniref:TonB family protein n=1 Tax=Chromobacterium phragmitis TaxID=2202141 RepID=UPI000DECCC7E|nr:TonB family protein [Chromobacterium phragmitis]AXE30224.1 hypothetical protein DK842_10105 [Chromobacterium phragmitis]
MSAARHPAVRWLYLLGGCAMVALAVIGALLPVMPTTIFLILALACFSKSSPRLEQKLLDHPRYGPGLRRWREQRIVPVKAKCFAALGMGGGFVALLLSRPPHWVPWLVAAIELAVLLYLLSRPSRPDDPAGWRLGPRGWRCLALLLCVALHLAALTAGLWWPGRQKAATAPAETPAMQWLAGGGDPVPAERRISERASAAASASRRAPSERQAGVAPDARRAPATRAAGQPLPAVNQEPPSPKAAQDQQPSQAAAPRPASRQSDSARASQGRDSWEARVLARLERYRQYPAASRLRGDEGTVYLSLRVDREGRVLAAQLSRGSGHPTLDQAALDTAYRAAPLPRIPEGLPDTLELAVPVEYFLDA